MTQASGLAVAIRSKSSSIRSRGRLRGADEVMRADVGASMQAYMLGGAYLVGQQWTCTSSRAISTRCCTTPSCHTQWLDRAQTSVVRLLRLQAGTVLPCILQMHSVEIWLISCSLQLPCLGCHLTLLAQSLRGLCCQLLVGRT